MEVVPDVVKEDDNVSVLKVPVLANGQGLGAVDHEDSLEQSMDQDFEEERTPGDEQEGPRL